MSDLGERVWERLDHLTWVRYKDKYGADMPVPPTTSSPADFLTGRGSPVIMDSSTAEVPDRTTASTRSTERRGSSRSGP